MKNRTLVPALVVAAAATTPASSLALVTTHDLAAGGHSGEWTLTFRINKSIGFGE